MPGYCKSIGMQEQVMQSLVLVHAYTVATGRRFIVPEELGQYLRWIDPKPLHKIIATLLKYDYLMLYAPAVEKRSIMRAYQRGEKPGKRFALTTFATDVLLTLWDYIEQFRENWNTDTSPIQYTDHPPNAPNIPPYVQHFD